MTTVSPQDPRFPNVTRGFNQRWIAHPSYVEVCARADDVVTAVRTAYEQGLRITARGGGHCYENFTYGNDGGVILDLTPMQGVYRDDATGWYVIEGGATLWDVYTVLEKLLEEISFDAGKRGAATVSIDAAYVDARLAELSKNEDLARFVL